MEPKNQDELGKPVKFVIVEEIPDPYGDQATEKPNVIAKSIFEEAGAEDEPAVSLPQAPEHQVVPEEAGLGDQGPYLSIVLGGADHVPHELSAQTNPVEELTEPTVAPGDDQVDGNTAAQSQFEEEAEEAPGHL